MEVDVPALLKRLAELEARVAELTKENAALRAEINTNSNNSGKPPSADPPGSPASKVRREKRQKKSSGRKAGGQPGHKGKTRLLLEPEAVDVVESLRPDACRGCGTSLAEAALEGDPERHQVHELPQVRPQVTEYLLNTCVCRGCGVRTRARLPGGVSMSAFGPRVHALVATLSGDYHVPRRRTRQLLADFFGLSVSLGAIAQMERRVDLAMTPIVDEIAEKVRTTEAPTGLDETGWRQAGERRWLWAAVAGKLAMFLIRESRGACVVTELLGETPSQRIIVTDRWSAYHHMADARRQFCWSHLLRDFQRMVEAPDAEAHEVGTELLSQGTTMFRWWHELRDGKLSREAFDEQLEVLKTTVGALLDRGGRCAHKKTAGTCRRLAKHQTSLWVFAHNEGVEPTNNHTERALRPAVIWRKICLGTQSEAGARFAERILSITATAHRQGRNVLDIMQRAVRARFGEGAVPSLVEMGT